MYTYQELWAKASKLYGAVIAPTTFRRWVEEFCLLDIQSTYDFPEADCVCELAQIARRYPKGSPRIKQTFRKRMKEHNATKRRSESPSSARSRIEGV